MEAFFITNLARGSSSIIHQAHGNPRQTPSHCLFRQGEQESSSDVLLAVQSRPGFAVALNVMLSKFFLPIPTFVRSLADDV